MTHDEQQRAADHLARVDDRFAEVIRRVGPPQLRYEPDAWRALANSIIGQQISTRAASAIRARFAMLVAGEAFPSPTHVLQLSDETLRGAGLSGNKARAVRDLAAHFADGRLSTELLAALPDEEVIQKLLPVRGVGRWTAEMFLIFSLGRPDVWAVDDLGLRAGVRRLYELAEMPNKVALTRIAEGWRPYRSIVSWYLWRWLDLK